MQAEKKIAISGAHILFLSLNLQHIFQQSFIVSLVNIMGTV